MYVLYQKGLHLVASLKIYNNEWLTQTNVWQDCINTCIEQFCLQKLGEIYHVFTNSGCTGVICLSESHISFHTWPEYNLVNIDIYLSNFTKDNSTIVKEIFTIIVLQSQAIIIEEKHLYR